jgi:ubiquitin-protein ligase
MMFCEVETPFEGGVFKMKIVIDSEFPNKPPKGMFSIFLSTFSKVIS